MKYFRHTFILSILLILVLGACTTAGIGKTDESLEITSTPQPEKSIYFIWLPPYLPQELRSILARSNQFRVTENRDQADLIVDVGEDQLLSEWIFNLAAPFPTISDSVSMSILQNVWQGEVGEDSPLKKLLLDGSTKAILEKLWGAASVATVEVIPRADLMAHAWEAKDAWSIIPFEQLEPGWKVIAIDGQSPIKKKFQSTGYPLRVPFSLIGDPEVIAAFKIAFSDGNRDMQVPASNRSTDKLTTVVVTGVTALVGGTASMMERNGMTYPVIDIGDLLRDADILHISNEVPFTATCPKAAHNMENRANLILCSRPEYIQLLEAIGTDVVELTGDHFRDWGPEAMFMTLDMYTERGWQYYGGGRNLDDGMQPALFIHNGNKIAFLGCNAKKQRGYANASETNPGAVLCDMNAMADAIQAVVSDGYIPIFTFQHTEYYSYKISDVLIDDFHQAAEAGAVIVSGSQAHQPHAFEFYKGSLLHYGLGNLFFDQIKESFPQRQAFIDRHIFYDGRYISTELETIMFVDYARSRFMTDNERNDLLQTVFAASGW